MTIHGSIANIMEVRLMNANQSIHSRGSTVTPSHRGPQDGPDDVDAPGPNTLSSTGNQRTNSCDRAGWLSGLAALCLVGFVVCGMIAGPTLLGFCLAMGALISLVCLVGAVDL